MGFDIRAIFSRALGGRTDRESTLPTAAPDAFSDEELPGSPISAAVSAAASPEADDMMRGGATAATALIPEGVAAIPTAAIDSHNAAMDDAIEDDQARLVALVAVAGAMAGAEPDEATFADLLETLQEVPGLDELTAADLRAMADELARDVEMDEPGAFAASMEERLGEIADTLVDPALRRAAYQLAVYYAGADGSLTDDETDLLEAIVEAFELGPMEARSLREATMMEASDLNDRSDRPSLS